MKSKTLHTGFFHPNHLLSQNVCLRQPLGYQNLPTTFWLHFLWTTNGLLVWNETKHYMIKNLTHCCEILRNYGSNRQQQQLPLSSSSHVNRFCMTSLAEIITSRQSLSQCHCTSKLGFWISGVQSFHHVRNSLQLLQFKDNNTKENARMLSVFSPLLHAGRLLPIPYHQPGR